MQIDAAFYSNALTHYEASCTNKTMTSGSWYRLAHRLEVIAGQFPNDASGRSMSSKLLDRAIDCMARGNRIKATEGVLV